MEKYSPEAAKVMIVAMEIAASERDEQLSKMSIAELENRRKVLLLKAAETPPAEIALRWKINCERRDVEDAIGKKYWLQYAASPS